ncbi:MAG: flavodoxin-dependent (E)-4-hydroxy-3-methylbut-2-enyl-diphosphate synthase [Sphaerochaetaceae bacterium]|jgi:(E)-4-hydroxy-3-methylbut-2-enyl-diphosphate synthase
MKRRVTHSVAIGDLFIGSAHPIAIQTMYSDPLLAHYNARNYEELLFSLRSWTTMGCHIIRFSYPDSSLKESFTQLCKDSPMPVVADIHFDYKLAIEAITSGAAKIRINPGNIGNKERVEQVVKTAKDHACSIRIGLNGGSLPRKLRQGDHTTAMVDTALEYLDWFEKWNFTDTVISLKDTDPLTTYNAYESIASQCSYPLHLGVTEAGGVVSAVARSSYVLGKLLEQGIGDTMRISITDDIFYEIAAAREILRTVGIERGGVNIISCPRCGRASFDSQAFLKKVERRLMEIQEPITVAIMGCQVNGPGEAEQADIAITGLGKRVFLYEKGKLVKEIDEQDAEKILFERIEELIRAQ